MSTFRIEKNKNYTIMSKYHLKEKNMSLKAKGLLCTMLSLPDDWDYSLNGLCSICKENITAIRSALDELKEFGYLKITRVHREGKIDWDYDIFEQPQSTINQSIENLHIDNLSIENQLQLSTKEVNTNKLKNTKNIKDKKQCLFPLETKNILKSNIDEILAYYNLVTNSKIKIATKTYRDLITARFNDFSKKEDKYTVQDFKDVIDYKKKDWEGTEFIKYLVPTTLFSKIHFDEYLQQSKKPKYKSNSQKTYEPAKQEYTDEYAEDNNKKIREQMEARKKKYENVSRETLDGE